MMRAIGGLLVVIASLTEVHSQKACSTGFVFDQGSGSCADIDECVTDNGGCDPRTKCYNTVGSRECGACPKDNYIGNGDTGCLDVNECLESEPKCDRLTKCQNTNGGFTCTKCPEGFSGSGRNGCFDVNECEMEVAACSPMVSCTNLIPDCADLTTNPVLCTRGFKCGSCPDGYKGDGIGQYGCTDVNECKKEYWFTHGLKNGQPPCGVKPCRNLEGTYECIGFDACEAGYLRNEDTGECDDINECLVNNGGCAPLTKCINLPGSSQCSDCPDGFEKDPATQICVDINECLVNNGGCDPRAECFNVNGTGGAPDHCGPIVVGACPSGFERANQNSPCVDINECLQGAPKCDPRTRCINTDGSYYCTDCPPGFIGSGATQCDDIDECAAVELANGDCDQLVVCTNTVPNRTCGECPAGYYGNGYDGCQDINECAIDNGGCAENTYCINTKGSFACGTCPNTKFTRLATVSGKPTCVDIDECKEQTHDCHFMSSCVNLESKDLADGTYSLGYECTRCPEGYTGGGWNSGGKIDSDAGTGTSDTTEGCKDKNECEIYGDEYLCGVVPCINTPGSYRCDYEDFSCPEGFKVIGYGTANATCEDINECLQGFNGECQLGDPECDPQNGGCDLNVECNNLQPGRSCGPCPAGYTGDGYTKCEDINECEVDNGGCNPLQVCINQVPHFRCEDCAEGYMKDPLLGCRDIDECSLGIDACNDLAACLNLNGTYACRSCIDGFRFGEQSEGYILGLGADGCTDVDECAEEKDNCDYSIGPNGGYMETCQNTVGGFVCIPWNATECDAPTATASTNMPEVAGLLLNGKVELYADESKAGSTPIKSYFWSLVSAPAGSSPRLQATVSQTAFASELAKKGEYVFEISVTDDCGKVSKDQVTVNKLRDEPTRELVAGAGSSTDQSWVVPRTQAPFEGVAPGVVRTETPIAGGLPTESGVVPSPPAAGPAAGVVDWTKPRTRSPTMISTGSSCSIAFLLMSASLCLSTFFSQ